MSLYLALLPGFLVVFGSSYLIHYWIDLMTEAQESIGDVQQVEVLNINDLTRR